MLGNIYQTQSGKDFMQGEEASNTLMNFCIFSMDSVNPKVVYTAALVLFNHILTYKRDRSFIDEECNKALAKITHIISDPNLVDAEALMGLLMCECRIVYKSKVSWDFVNKQLQPKFKQNHD